MASSVWKTALGAALLLILPPALAIDLNLCASFNTADTNRNVSIYQTNGLCSDFCRNEYAYAITQVESCWCSNFTPSEDSQSGLSSCDIPCPAFPSENCGGRGLFGYIELNGRLPEGTRGPEEDEPTSTEESPPSSTTSIEVPPPTTEPESETTSSTSTSSSITDEEETTTTSQIETVTTDGEVRTVTVVPTITPTNEGESEEGTDGGSASDSGNDGLGTGGIVGIVVGVVGGILVIAGLVLFWFFKKRKRSSQSAYQGDPSVRDDSSDRLGSARPDMAMANAGSGSPTSGVGSNSNRNSTLAIDPRMDPFRQGLYMRNASHESINTLRDDHDYSRRIQPKVLRATNPDADAQ